MMEGTQNGGRMTLLMDSLSIESVLVLHFKKLEFAFQEVSLHFKPFSWLSETHSKRLPMISWKCQTCLDLMCRKIFIA